MAAGAEVSGDRVVAVSAAEFSPAVVNTETGYNAGGDSDDVKGGSDPKPDTKMRDFVNMLSKLKLNPLAKEFIPSYLHDRKQNQFPGNKICSADENFGQNGVQNNRRRKNNYYQSNRRLNGRVLKAQREDSIRRTVYVSEIDQTVTEEKLAELFGSKCGHVVDCRICGDPSSRLRFAFVEFADERGAGEALNLCGTVVGFYPIKVLPSKTAILPVNPTFLPRSEDEREMCARTVYCTNIDKQITQADLKSFFESFCGEVSRLRLLGDNVHSTRIAFVEFCVAESAIAALGCCGKLLGTQPIRVSPSKTPVRPRIIRPAHN